MPELYCQLDWNYRKYIVLFQVTGESEKVKIQGSNNLKMNLNDEHYRLYENKSKRIEIREQICTII